MNLNLIGQGIGALGGPLLNHFSNERDIQNQRDMANDNIQMQREFAQNGVRWRVEDARNAGIHPLAALGMQGASYSPVSIGDTRNNALGDGLSNMGQNIARAAEATSTASERSDKYMDLQIENQSLQNELLKGQIIGMNQHSQIGPPMPPSNSGLSSHLLGGQGNSSPSGRYVTEKPAERFHSQPNNPAQEAGSINDYAYVRTPSGMAIVPSADAKQRIEDQFIPEVMWSYRNHVLPLNRGHPAPDPKYYPLPKGYDHWKWDGMSQEYRPAHSSPYSNEYRNRSTMDRFLLGN